MVHLKHTHGVFSLYSIRNSKFYFAGMFTTVFLKNKNLRFVLHKQIRWIMYVVLTHDLSEC